MKRVRLSITVLDTIDFDDDMAEEQIDGYVDSISYKLQNVLDKADLGCVNDIEYSVEKIDDEDEGLC